MLALLNCHSTCRRNKLFKLTMNSVNGDRLRILWLSHLVPYPPKGGVLIRSYHLLTQVARHHEVDLFAFNQKRMLASYFPDLETGLREAQAQLGKWVRWQWMADIPCQRWPQGEKALAAWSLLSKDPYTINWLKSAEAGRQIAEIVRNGGYDLVHYDTISLAPYLEPCAHLPTVLDHHNEEAHMLIRRAEKAGRGARAWYFRQEGRRLREYQRRMLGRFDLHLACSDEDRERLLDIDPGINVEVIPNGIPVDRNRAPVREPASPPRLLFIGGLDWYPNRDAVHFLLEEIWPLLKRRRPDVLLDIVGKAPSERMKAVAERDPAVRLHGFVDDIEPFYREGAVYVCPIRDGGGTKLKMLDAFAHGIPVVAHPIAAEGLEVEDGRDLLLRDSPEGFCEAVCTLLDNTDLARSLSEAAHERVAARYAVEGIGERLADLYGELVHRRRLGGEAAFVRRQAN